MFSKAFTLLPDERTSTSIQLAFSGCVLLLCRFVAVGSFFEETVLAKPSPFLIVAPPLFSRGLWLLLPYSHVYAMFGSIPSFVFCFEVQKKKMRCTVVGCLQAGSRLSPQIPSESNQCLRRFFERYTLLFCTCLPFFCRTVNDEKKKKCSIRFGSCTFLYIWVLRDPTFPAKRKTEKNV